MTSIYSNTHAHRAVNESTNDRGMRVRVDDGEGDSGGESDSDGEGEW